MDRLRCASERVCLVEDEGDDGNVPDDHVMSIAERGVNVGQARARDLREVLVQRLASPTPAAAELIHALRVLGKDRLDRLKVEPVKRIEQFVDRLVRRVWSRGDSRVLSIPRSPAPGS